MKRRILFFIILLLQVSVCSLSAATKKEVQSMIETQRYAEAVHALRSLMQQPAFARDADCNKWMGQSLCLTGNYEESVPYLENAIRQNRKSGALWYLAIARQYLYDYEGALDALDDYRPVLNSDLWLSRADSLERMIQQGIRAMEHVQEVVVIDSLTVSRDDFFSYYKLGDESGRVMMEDGALLFENQAADYRILSIENQLYQSHRILGEWQEMDPMPGLGSEQFQVIAPFLRADGETLYFASDSLPGLGGLDLYKTKYNAEEGVYYQPERLGMPFNSPYDDYMMAIDETHQVGWWATNRNCDADHVTIYIFLLEDDPDYYDEATVEQARLDNIRATWKKKEGYAELMASIMNADQKEEEAPSIEIIINDQKVYTDENQFVSAAAKNAYLRSVSLGDELAEKTSRLELLREEFAHADAKKRSQLRTEILSLEQNVLLLTKEYQAKVKEYRSLE